MTELIKTRLPVPSLSKVPTDGEMAMKYLIDIINDGTPEMVDRTREILKALWMRLIDEEPDASDRDLGDAIGRWYRTMSTAKLYAQQEIEG